MKVNDIGVIQFLNVISRALLIHFSIIVNGNTNNKGTLRETQANNMGRIYYIIELNFMLTRFLLLYLCKRLYIHFYNYG